jgi:hypothetical protein
MGLCFKFNEIQSALNKADLCGSQRAKIKTSSSLFVGIAFLSFCISRVSCNPKL